MLFRSVRNANTEARAGAMPRFGADGLLTQPQIGDVAEFVASLSQREAPRDAAAARRGAQLFVENCAACHGDRGAGNQELGAPNLSDGIWLYGGDRATLMQSISNGRNGSMPAWSERLAPETVKMLAVYVHSLGGGK